MKKVNEYDINIHLSAEGVLSATIVSPEYPADKIKFSVSDLGFLMDVKDDLMEFVSEIKDKDV